MLRALGRIQNQTAARHAHEIPVQEIDEPARGIICLHGSWKLTHAGDPFLEWNYIGARDFEYGGEDEDHLAP